MMKSIIEKRRKVVGLSREDLAKVMGIDRNQYGRRLKSDKGFYEVEILRAVPVLGLKLLCVVATDLVDLNEVVKEPAGNDNGWRSKLLAKNVQAMKEALIPINLP